MIRIVWDIDDVLNDLTCQWYAEYAGRSQVTLPFEQLRKNPPCEELGLPLTVYCSSLDDFRRRRMLHLTPRANVRRWFDDYGAACRHMALTSAPLATAHLSAAWVMRNFGEWIRTFHVVPSSRQGEHPPAYERTKADALRGAGQVDLFIDDQPDNVDRVAALGIKTLLFPAPWNAASRVSVDRWLDQLTAMVVTGEDR